MTITAAAESQPGGHRTSRTEAVTIPVPLAERNWRLAPVRFAAVPMPVALDLAASKAVTERLPCFADVEVRS